MQSTRQLDIASSHAKSKQKQLLSPGPHPISTDARESVADPGRAITLSKEYPLERQAYIRDDRGEKRR
jgi:hypothetical protein